MINVLKLALPLVNITHPNMEVVCRRLIGTEIDERGVVSPNFEEFTAKGQVQPVTVSTSGNQANQSVAPIKMNVWIMAELHSVDTQQVADQIVYDGRVWNVLVVNNWNPGNGWGNYTITENKAVKSFAEGDKEDTNGDGLKW